MSFVIAQEGPAPAYFSPRAGRNLAQPAGGWTEVVEDAMQFARDKDAKEFMDLYAPTLVTFCTVKPI